MNKSFFFFCVFFLLITKLHAQESKTKKQEELITSLSQKADYFLKTLQVHYKNGDYQLHKDYSDSLYSIAKKNNLTKMHVLALVNQAVFYKNRSELQRAVTLYHEALEKCKLIPNDRRTNIIVLVNLGNIYDNMGLIEKSNESMERVLVLTDTMKTATIVRAAALIGLSNNYARLNKHEKTLEYAIKAKRIGEQTKNEMIVATALGNISDSYYHQKKYIKALEMGQKALAISSQQKSTKKRASILLNIGLAHFKLNNIEKAITNLEEAKQIAIEKKILEIEMYTHEHLAQLYEQKGELEKANGEQKSYIKTRNIYLQEEKEAGKLELKKDINIKDKEIVENKALISNMENKTKNLMIIGSLICLSLGGALFFYIKRKKIIEQEKIQLRTQYAKLKKTITNLKTHNSTSAIDTKKTVPTSYKNSSLNSQDYEYYKKTILSFMEKEKPFLNPDLKQVDLAKKLELSSHHFSELLNFCFNQNFYNFINSYRVLEAQNLIRKDNYKDAKIIAVAFDAGFKSKTSFNRIFKKHTGLTPTDYKKTI